MLQPSCLSFRGVGPGRARGWLWAPGRRGPTTGFRRLSKVACCKKGDSGLMLRSALLGSSITDTRTGRSADVCWQGRSTWTAVCVPLLHALRWSGAIASPSLRNVLQPFRLVGSAVLHDFLHSRFPLEKRAVKLQRKVAFQGHGFPRAKVSPVWSSCWLKSCVSRDFAGLVLELRSRRGMIKSSCFCFINPRF